MFVEKTSVKNNEKHFCFIVGRCSAQTKGMERKGSSWALRQTVSWMQVT